MKNNLFDLSGQVAFCCGGSSGLGLQFAKAMANAGADIALVARRTDRLDENAREIEAEYGVKVYPHYMDLQDSKSITDCVSDVVAHFGKIDILVNAAGIPGGGDPATLTDEYWLNVINTDLNGQFFTCREVVRQSMKPNQYGRIIMVSSIHGVCGRKGVDTAPYAAAKGGIVNLTRSLGNSWARDGITVNCICPGYFPTEMTAAYIDAPFFHQAHLECCPWSATARPAKWTACAPTLPPRPAATPPARSCAWTAAGAPSDLCLIRLSPRRIAAKPFLSASGGCVCPAARRVMFPVSPCAFLPFIFPPHSMAYVPSFPLRGSRFCCRARRFGALRARLRCAAICAILRVR